MKYKKVCAELQINFIQRFLGLHKDGACGQKTISRMSYNDKF